MESAQAAWRNAKPLLGAHGVWGVRPGSKCDEGGGHEAPKKRPLLSPALCLLEAADLPSTLPLKTDRADTARALGGWRDRMPETDLPD